MKHILVIDDDRDILTCLEEALSTEGYRVSAAVSGAEGLDVVAGDLPDLVILDLRMPQMSGLEVLQEIRRKHARLPVIVCSALAKYRTDFEVINANVSAFVDKPIDLDKLMNTISLLLGTPPPAPRTLPSDQPREQTRPH